MKKRSWKQVLAGLLAIAVMVTSVPPVDVLATELSPQQIQLFDYNKLYSAERGNSFIVGFKNKEQQIEKGYGNYLVGERAFVEYSLAYNSPVNIELYSIGNGTETRLGFVYGLEYTENRTGTISKFTSTHQNLETIKNKLNTISINQGNFVTIQHPV